MEIFENILAHLSVWQCADILLRLLVACICGAVIGVERTKRFKEAGIRTHVIVCCASALMMVISKYGFEDLAVQALGTRISDGGRIAAQIVPGISFLCAGVIFKNGNTIKGLTTAAGIWFTAAVGMTAGAGMYWLAAVSTLIIMLLQLLMHRYTIGNDSVSTYMVKIVTASPKRMEESWQVFLQSVQGKIEHNRITHTREETTYRFNLRVPGNISQEQWQELIDGCEDITLLEHKVVS